MLFGRSIAFHPLIDALKLNYLKAFADFHEGSELAEKVGEEAYHFLLLSGLGWLFGECGQLSKVIMDLF
jgi:hypothetical protein